METSFLFRLFMLALIFQAASITPSYAIVTGGKFNSEKSQELGREPKFSAATRVFIQRENSWRLIMATAYEGHLITSAHIFNEDDFKKKINTDGSASYLPFIFKKGKSRLVGVSDPLKSIIYGTQTYHLEDGSCVDASTFLLYKALSKDKISGFIEKELRNHMQQAQANIEAIYISEAYEKGFEGLVGRLAFIKLKKPVDYFKGAKIGKLEIDKNITIKGLMASYHINGKNTDEILQNGIQYGEKKHVMRTPLKKDGNYFTNTIKLVANTRFPHQFDDEGDVDPLRAIPWQGDSGAPLFGQNKGTTLLLGICEGATMLAEIVPEKKEPLPVLEETEPEIKEKELANVEKNLQLSSKGASNLPSNSILDCNVGELTQTYLYLYGRIDWINDCITGRIK